MKKQLKLLSLIFLVVLLMSSVVQNAALAAAVETPKGKKIPGRIVDEGAEEYKMETDLPGGGKIIFNVDKEKVDPHGTVPGAGRIEEIKGTAETRYPLQSYLTERSCVYYRFEVEERYRRRSSSSSSSSYGWQTVRSDEVRRPFYVRDDTVFTQTFDDGENQVGRGCTLR